MSGYDSHTGSSFDSFLEDEGILGDVEAAALKRVIAWTLEEEMRNQRITKQAMAERMHTSRSQLDRLLDPTNPAVQLTTIARAGVAVGLRFTLGMERIPQTECDLHAA